MRAEERITQLLRHVLWQPPQAEQSRMRSQSISGLVSPSLTSGFHNYQIPVLKTLDQMVDAIKLDSSASIDFSKVAVIAVQHNLETTVTLFQALQKLGISHIYTLGKCYSDSEPIMEAMVAQGICLIPSSKPAKIGQYLEAALEDVKTLWRTCLNNIEGTNVDTLIVLDDGGRCLASAPPEVIQRYKMAGVEQTRGGLYLKKIKSLLFPVVDVASSALKRWVEPPFIAKAALQKVTAVLKQYDLMDKQGKPNKHAVIGVVGVGAIGAAIAKYLCSLGYLTNIYDKDEQIIQQAHIYGACRVGSLKDLIMNSNCIFGCTGEDLTSDLSLDEMIEQDTLLISCSSEDKEYKNELQKIAKKSEGIVDIVPLSTFTARSQNGSKMVFVRGGFPANFDGSPWNVPAVDIEATQAALFGAVYQSLYLTKPLVTDGVSINRHKILMLDPIIQRFIIETRCDNKNAKVHEQQLVENFRNLQWVISESGKNNQYQENPILSACFNKSNYLLASPVNEEDLPRLTCYL
ncbi:MAG: hypothetical protein K2Q14_01425 [Gammaproteobacteria bacterium]|nr:hypothetical protein [Gammaproteobacteria bacterium]